MKQLGKLGRVVSFFFLVGLVGLVLGLKRCQQNSNFTSGVVPISPENDVPFSIYDVNADTDTTLYTETGTILTIESGTLVTQGGIPVNGKVQVSVREFHDAVDILRAGIPMRLSSDKNNFLISSGMIEIRAYQNGQELFIGEGKSIATNLAAYRSSSQHQLFFLKDNEQWEVRDTFITKSNIRKENRLKSLLYLKKKSQVGQELEDLVFELYGDQDAAPQVQAWRGQKWKIAKENVTPAVQEALRINWDSVKVIRVNEKQSKYKLLFWKTMNQLGDESQVTKNFSVYAIPVSEAGIDIVKTMRNRFLSEDSIKKEVESEITRINKEADLVNAFKINKMGIWNIDRAIKLSDFIPVRASFDFQSTFKSFQRVRLFCVLKEDNSVVDFLDWQKEPIFLSVERPMQIAAVLPSGNIAYVDFDQIRQRLAQGSNEVVFTTKERTAQDYFSYLSTF
jgi:hypothetical protein